jgi:cyclophilin family peptidyl-prolyl cis-trans isomerase
VPALALAAAALAPLPAAATATAAATAAATDTWVVLETDAGRLVINLLEEIAPDHAENFKKLVRQGWYDGSPFHRVIDGFMAQAGGHWLDGRLVTDVGYTLPAEIDPRARHVPGAVAAARRGDDANPRRRSSGSQFFVTFARIPSLDGQYTVFGQVVEGLDVLTLIQRGPPAADGLVPSDRATTVRRAWLQDAGELRAAGRPAAATPTSSAPTKQD